MTCHIDTCEKPTRSRGLCESHYRRLRLYGDPLHAPRTPGTCTVDGCDARIKDSGLCPKHRSRLARHGTTDDHRARQHGPAGDRMWRFATPVDADTCWEWAGNRNQHGYGRLDTTYAHRLSWEFHHGPIPDGLVVMHACDNPPCVNPWHLRLGTQVENMRDMARKGRRKRSAA